MPADELDGRVVRALLNRELLAWEDDRERIAPTDAGREYIEVALSAPLTRRQKQVGGRAAVIHRLLEKLEGSIPPDSEVQIGQMQAAAGDVLDGLRRYARRVDTRR